jgi:hypothetical protein
MVAASPAIQDDRVDVRVARSIIHLALKRLKRNVGSLIATDYAQIIIAPI